MFFALVLFVCAWHSSRAACGTWGTCSGHGKCNYTASYCLCDEGWGASTDITTLRSPDCSTRVCPSGKSWGDVPTSENEAHALAECSDRGICDRVSGRCVCANGFEGSACQRMKCPNDCSGHGRCLNMEMLAITRDATPLSTINHRYGITENRTTVSWDDRKLFACVCDSSWRVGLGSNETQQSEWFGADCSLRHCPSGDDPRTDAIETDCYNVTAPGSTFAGEYGNLCHVECSNRGTCDYSTGLCSCYPSYYGSACSLTSAMHSAQMNQGSIDEFSESFTYEEF